jgi:hypothetical protein
VPVGCEGRGPGVAGERRLSAADGIHGIDSRGCGWRGLHGVEACSRGAGPADGARAGAPGAVNGVAPGFMRTDIRGPQSLGLGGQTPSSVPDLEQLASAAVPLGFLPSPEDYTGHYVQLASRANAPATTGIVVACDGGLDVLGLADLELQTPHRSRYSRSAP